MTSVTSRIRNTVTLFAVVLIVEMMTDAYTASAQLFELVSSSGNVTAEIDLRPDGLSVYQRVSIAGRRTKLVYSRDAFFDARGSSWLGYYNLRTNRVLRFPRSGVGPIGFADLNSSRPRYILTRQTLRPRRLRQGGRHHHHGHLPIFTGIGSPIVFYPTFGYGAISPYSIYPYGVNPFVNSYLPSPFAGNALVPGFPAGGFTPALPPTQSIVLDSKFVPHPDLPDVDVVLVNGGRRELRVTMVDRVDSSKSRQFAMGPGEQIRERFKRDSGGTRISQIQTITPFGESSVREVSSQVPPRVRYQLDVHEMRVQSVSIDRTSPSGNLIDDVNFHGKGLGSMLLPAGDKLQPGKIDVYQSAVAQQNSQLVAPILATEDDRDAPSTLEQSIIDAQQAARRRLR